MLERIRARRPPTKRYPVDGAGLTAAPPGATLSNPRGAAGPGVPTPEPPPKPKPPPPPDGAPPPPPPVPDPPGGDAEGGVELEPPGGTGSAEATRVVNTVSPEASRGPEAPIDLTRKW